MSIMALLLFSGLLAGPWMMLPGIAYVWVSGFGAQPTTVAHSLALTAAGPFEDGAKSYTVASASPGLSYVELTFTVDGVAWPFTESCDAVPGSVALCRGERAANATDQVLAGDVVTLAGVSQGATLRVIDAASNSVILALTVG